MYDDKYHFIIFTLFSGLLSGFGFEIVTPEPDPIRISGLVFRFQPDPFVKDWIGLSYFWVLFTVLIVYHLYSHSPLFYFRLWYELPVRSLVTENLHHKYARGLGLTSEDHP